MSRFLLLLTLWLFSPTLLAQELHLILFNSKDTTGYASPSSFLTERSLQRRAHQGIALNERDYPVTPAHWQAVAQTGATVRYATRWLNGVLVSATAEQVNDILALSFVKKASQVSKQGNGTRVDEAKLWPIALPPKQEIMGIQELNYGNSLAQLSMLGVPAMHKDGFFGQGMLVAVLDAGFDRVNRLPVFDSLKLKGTYDFVQDETSVFEDDSHGMKVLSVMAGYAPGQLFGPAYRAEYLLFRTEEVAAERPVEEVYWLLGAERADSLGADLINSSLGYFDFDNQVYNHAKAEFDGNTTIIARAADFAASVGILVVNSAGNEGSGSWGYISTPADADSIMTVGGVDRSLDYWPVSSPGPTADGQIKPDVVALGSQVLVAGTSGNFVLGNGTSYSSPLACALAAGVWSAYPELTNMELLDILRRSGNNRQNPNNLVGYGIPSYERVKTLLSPNGRSEEGALSTVFIYPNPVEKNAITLVLPQSLQGKKLHISIYSTEGQLLKEIEMLANAPIQVLTVDNYPKGLYLLRIQDGAHEKTMKLVVE